MRPRKKILLVSSDEEGNQVHRYVLWAHHYDVTAAISSAEALEQLHGRQFDLLLCELPLKGIQSLLKKAQALNPLMNSLVLTGKPAVNGNPTGPLLDLDATAQQGICSMEVLLQRVKWLTRSKRGPKKAPTVDRMMEIVERWIA